MQHATLTLADCLEAVAETRQAAPAGTLPSIERTGTHKCRT